MLISLAHRCLPLSSEPSEVIHGFSVRQRTHRLFPAA
jgi:hypothetical protein